MILWTLLLLTILGCGGRVVDPICQDGWKVCWQSTPMVCCPDSYTCGYKGQCYAPDPDASPGYSPVP